MLGARAELVSHRCPQMKEVSESELSASWEADRIICSARAGLAQRPGRGPLGVPECAAPPRPDQLLGAGAELDYITFVTMS